MERRITVEEASIYEEDYQMRMLEANDIEGILKVRGRGMNGNSCYDYDVSGKISIKHSLYFIKTGIYFLRRGEILFLLLSTEKHTVMGGYP